MGAGRSDKLHTVAVRIALTSVLSPRQFADDLSVGLSNLSEWLDARRNADIDFLEDRVLARANERLRREIHILKQEGAS